MDIQLIHMGAGIGKPAGTAVVQERDFKEDAPTAVKTEKKTENNPFRSEEEMNQFLKEQELKELKLQLETYQKAGLLDKDELHQFLALMVRGAFGRSELEFLAQKKAQWGQHHLNELR